MRRSKTWLWVVSFILALVVAALVFPTPNHVHGGTVKMILLIFLTVGFKAGIEAVLKRRSRGVGKATPTKRSNSDDPTGRSP